MKTYKINYSGNKFSRLFDFWLWLNGRKFNILKDSCKNVVFDNCDIIDTLGSESEIKRFTYLYSDELVFTFGFIVFNLFEIEFIKF